jgi:N-acyl amino acid synthase FeeM
MFTERNLRFAPDFSRPSRALSLVQDNSRTGFDYSFVATQGGGAGEPVRASVALAERRLEAASKLVAERYAWRGYIPPTRDSSDDDRAITLIAETGGTTVGTMTVRLDGPQGLRVDENYPDQVSALRSQGRKVCELTQLALAAQADTKVVLSTLFGLAYRLGTTLHDVTDVLIEVNPRHVQFYRRLLGFAVAAGERLCERVQAPAVLLRASVEELEKRLLAYCNPDAIDETVCSVRRLCTAMADRPAHPILAPANVTATVA